LFVLTNYPDLRSILAMPVAAQDVRSVQACYPRIYLACHLQHTRRTPARANVTEGESSLLAHLHEREAIRASDLARHMGVSRSSMSATIKRLITLGYITRARDSTDARAAALRLSPSGARAMQAGSVLDTGRVAALLAQLSPADRKTALAGLALLARAADRLPRKKWSAR
jgi:DNA-binding MarR family transcriptional regulator